jgi:hypothetical protein
MTFAKELRSEVNNPFVVLVECESILKTSEEMQLSFSA